MVNWDCVGQQEQGLTQTGIQPAANSSASTPDDSEEQVWKACFQIGDLKRFGFRVRFFSRAKTVLGQLQS